MQGRTTVQGAGRALNFIWVICGSNGASGISSITDPIGRKVQYAYNAAGMLSTVTDAHGGVTTYAYSQSMPTRSFKRHWHP